MTIVSKVEPNIFHKTYQYFILLVGVLLLLPKVMFLLPGTELDDSWIISIKLAVEKGMSFGEEYIFTFGPLGFLWTRFPPDGIRYVLVLFDLFTICLFLFIGNYTLQKASDKKAGFLFLLVILLNSVVQDAVLRIYIIFLFLLFYSFKYKNIYTILLAACIAILNFYIKVNFGIVIIILYSLFLILTYMSQRTTLIQSLYLFAFLLILLFGASYFLNVSLTSYIISSLHIINVYNDAMYLAIDFGDLKNIGSVTSALLLLLGFAVIPLFYYKVLIKDLFSTFIYFYIAGSFYLLFKQAFLRYDVFHYLLFFSFSPALIGLAYLFIAPAINKYMLKLLYISIIVASINILVGVTWNPMTPPYVDLFDGYTYEEHKTANYNYFASKMQLSSNLLKKINRQSVDVLPTKISYAYFNNLNYNPRPVIQSYKAYDSYLTAINYEKYMSATAPEYLIFTMDAIDRRHPMWDDPGAQLAMLQHYQYLGTEIAADTLLIFKRLNQAYNLEVKTVKKQTIKLGEPFKIDKTNNIQFVYADIKYSLFGKIERFLFQPAISRAVVTYEDGSEKRFRAIPPLMKAGVLLNKKVLTNQDAISYFKHHGSENIDATSIMFYGRRLSLNSEIEVTVQELVFSQNGQ